MNNWWIYLQKYPKVELGWRRVEKATSIEHWEALWERKVHDIVWSTCALTLHDVLFGSFIYTWCILSTHRQKYQASSQFAEILTVSGPGCETWVPCRVTKTHWPLAPYYLAVWAWLDMIMCSQLVHPTHQLNRAQTYCFSEVFNCRKCQLQWWCCWEIITQHSDET